MYSEYQALMFEHAKIVAKMRAIRVREIRIRNDIEKDKVTDKLCKRMESLILRVNFCHQEFDDLLDQIEARLNYEL